VRMTDSVDVLSVRGDEAELDFASMCKLGFSCRILQTQFQRTRRVYLTVSQNMKRWTLPMHIRSVTVCVRKTQSFKDSVTERTLKWWLYSLLSSNREIQCTVQCGRVTKPQWIALTAYLYRFVQRRGELRGPLHIFVAGFRSHKQAPCRCPTELSWVADRAHLLFHISSRITIGTPNVDISSGWVLSRLGCV